jgi:hypothetical protein
MPAIMRVAILNMFILLNRPMFWRKVRIIAAEGSITIALRLMSPTCFHPWALRQLVHVAKRSQFAREKL